MSVSNTGTAALPRTGSKSNLSSSEQTSEPTSTSSKFFKPQSSPNVQEQTFTAALANKNAIATATSASAASALIEPPQSQQRTENSIGKNPALNIPTTSNCDKAGEAATYSKDATQHSQYTSDTATTSQTKGVELKLDFWNLASFAGRYFRTQFACVFFVSSMSEIHKQFDETIVETSRLTKELDSMNPFSSTGATIFYKLSLCLTSVLSLIFSPIIIPLSWCSRKAHSHINEAILSLNNSQPEHYQKIVDSIIDYIEHDETSFFKKHEENNYAMVPPMDMLSTTFLLKMKNIGLYLRAVENKPIESSGQSQSPPADVIGGMLITVDFYLNAKNLVLEFLQDPRVLGTRTQNLIVSKVLEVFPKV